MPEAFIMTRLAIGANKFSRSYDESQLEGDNLRHALRHSHLSLRASNLFERVSKMKESFDFMILKPDEFEPYLQDYDNSLTQIDALQQNISTSIVDSLVSGTIILNLLVVQTKGRVKTDHKKRVRWKGAMEETLMKKKRTCKSCEVLGSLSLQLSIMVTSRRPAAGTQLEVSFELGQLIELRANLNTLSEKRAELELQSTNDRELREIELDTERQAHLTVLKRHEDQMKIIQTALEALQNTLQAKRAAKQAAPVPKVASDALRLRPKQGAGEDDAEDEGEEMLEVEGAELALARASSMEKLCDADPDEASRQMKRIMYQRDLEAINDVFLKRLEGQRFNHEQVLRSKFADHEKEKKALKERYQAQYDVEVLDNIRMKEFIEDMGFDPITLQCLPGIEVDVADGDVGGGVEAPVVEDVAVGATTDVVADGAELRPSTVGAEGVSTEKPIGGEDAAMPI
ncbi:hypothetical protein GIB67_009868 [Kingdonia uniflora]|uniref:Uncharacterized protein n=1 Tax=Kingdonia uniflora TaxID=39325 RepID=A0A7J7L7Y6_9MAGN|nr:hypothetical protein GIB67_009868 [Kingdonia uniflora]